MTADYGEGASTGMMGCTAGGGGGAPGVTGGGSGLLGAEARLTTHRCGVSLRSPPRVCFTSCQQPDATPAPASAFQVGNRKQLASPSAAGRDKREARGGIDGEEKERQAGERGGGGIMMESERGRWPGALLLILEHSQEVSPSISPSFFCPSRARARTRGCSCN